MSLSPELRDRIYDLALHPDEEGDGGISGSRLIRVGAEKRWSPELSVRGRSEAEEEAARTLKERNDLLGPVTLTTWTQHPSLTRVSKEIRCETLPIYYGSNHFVVTIDLLEKRGNRLPSRFIHNPDSRTTYGADTWLNQIGASNVALIRNVEICFTDAMDDIGRSMQMYGVRSLDDIFEETLSRLKLGFGQRVRFFGLWPDCDFEDYWVPLSEASFRAAHRRSKVNHERVLEETSMIFRPF